MQDRKQWRLPKEIKSVRDIIYTLRCNQYEFEQVKKNYEKVEISRYTRQEMRETDLEIEALGKACKLLERDKLNKPYATGECPNCKELVPAEKWIGDKIFYCQSCGQKLSYKINSSMTE